jgi:uncharacterized membrane protein
MRVASVGHALFAATLIGLGILGLIKGGFAPIWDSVPKDLPGRELLAYLCALIALVCGLGLLWERTAAIAARVLFYFLLLWMLLIKVRLILLMPLVEGAYQSWGETAVIVAGAWILYAWFASPWDRQRLGFAVGEQGVRVATSLYALALIAFGLSHFVYLNLTAPLVPKWLPAHTFWAYFTGCAYLAAGVAILIDICAKLAAVLSAWQIGLFLLLVWVPIVAGGHANAEQWSETVVNVALLAGAWVVADSYRVKPWLTVARS